MSDIQVADGLKKGDPGGTITWPRGKLVVPEGTVVKALYALVAFNVEATVADGNGMGPSAQAAALTAVEVTLKTDLGTSSPETPINGDDLATLQVDAQQILERDIVGGPGQAASVGEEKGLQAALAAGANRLVVAVPISLGHVEFINQSPQLYGCGASDLLDCELTFKLSRDLLAGVEPNVKITGYEVDLRVIPQRTNSDGEPSINTVAYKEVKGGEEDTIEGPDFLTLAVDDINSELDDTKIREITVSVGGQVVTTDPAEPKDVQFRFLQDPNTGATEAGVANVRTPLFRCVDQDLRDMMPGKVVVTQDEHLEDLIARYAGFPLVPSKKVVERVMARARRDDAGGYIHAVNAAAVEGIPVGDEHLPFTGMRYFKTEDVRFHTMAGLRARRGGKVFVWMPLQDLMMCATEYNLAMQDRTGDENTAKAAARAVLIKFGASIPGIFDSSKGAPPKGRETAVFRVLKRMVTDMLEDMAEVRARRPEKTALRRQALTDAGKSADDLYAVELE
ncbi:MAG TPA: hypothetical protein VK539_03135 [Myxococcaceae bacterium]|nr:hypothetical protein [Myxococcaceae bacterium]